MRYQKALVCLMIFITPNIVDHGYAKPVASVDANWCDVNNYNAKSDAGLFDWQKLDDSYVYIVRMSSQDEAKKKLKNLQIVQISKEIASSYIREGKILREGYIYLVRAAALNLRREDLSDRINEGTLFHVSISTSRNKLSVINPSLGAPVGAIPISIALIVITPRLISGYESSCLSAR